MPLAGSALPIVTALEPPVAGPAIPIIAYAGTADRPIDAGPAQPVYVVSQAQIANGTFKLAGNAQPVVMVVVTGRTRTAGKPIAVYLVSGSVT